MAGFAFAGLTNPPRSDKQDADSITQLAAIFFGYGALVSAELGVCSWSNGCGNPSVRIRMEFALERTESRAGAMLGNTRFVRSHALAGTGGNVFAVLLDAWFYYQVRPLLCSHRARVKCTALQVNTLNDEQAVLFVKRTLWLLAAVGSACRSRHRVSPNTLVQPSYSFMAGTMCLVGGPPLQRARAANLAVRVRLWAFACFAMCNTNHGHRLCRYCVWKRV